MNTSDEHASLYFYAYEYFGGHAHVHVYRFDTRARRDVFVRISGAEVKRGAIAHTHQYVRLAYEAIWPIRVRVLEGWV